jgi:AcrR family transcriptional regulator
MATISNRPRAGASSVSTGAGRAVSTGAGSAVSARAGRSGARSSARERLLDAFQDLLVTEGEQATTLDAVAARAQVSKGGLLYHFRSKEALVDGLLDRLRLLADDDVKTMRAAPEGSIAYLLRTSTIKDSPLEHTILACACLAQARQGRVRDALNEMQQRWYTVVEESVDDPALARLIMLASDGLYFNSMLQPEGAESGYAGSGIDDLLRLIDTLRSSAHS